MPGQIGGRLGAPRDLELGQEALPGSQLAITLAYGWRAGNPTPGEDVRDSFQRHGSRAAAERDATVPIVAGEAI